jgi:hypothetical protein
MSDPALFYDENDNLIVYSDFIHENLRPTLYEEIEKTICQGKAILIKPNESFSENSKIFNTMEEFKNWKL